MAHRRRTPMPRPDYQHKLKWRMCPGCGCQMDVTLPPPACRISQWEHDAVAESLAAGMDPHCPSSRIAFANARLYVASSMAALTPYPAVRPGRESARGDN